MKLRILCIAVLMAWPLTIGAKEYRGRELYLIGNSAASLGRAGTGAALSGPDHVFLNPASIGDVERIGLGLQYGSPPLPTGFNDVGAVFVLPSSYGVFGTTFRYLRFQDSRDIRSGQVGGFHAAREITRSLLLGCTLDVVHADGIDGHSYYAGGALGFIYKFSSTGVRHGFCLKEPRLGLAVDFGYPFGKNPSYVDSNRITIGYGFMFFTMKHADISWFNDFTVLNYRAFPVKFGIEATFAKIVTARGGYIVPHAYNDGCFTTGIGLTLDTEYFNGSLNYSINFYPSLKLAHYFGLTCQIGSVDYDPPHTSLRPDHEYLSPNRDGSKDYTIFTLTVSDRSRIKGWRLTITDGAGRQVKDFAISERDSIDQLTAEEFFRRLVKKRESIVVPEKIVWDGTDGKGVTVPDGRYSYSFIAWDERNNIAVAKTGEIVVDTIPPEVSIDKVDALFSPNGDGRKDFFVVSQRVKSDPDDRWRAGFADRNGTVVKRYEWQGNGVPAKLMWDGKDDSGVDLPEGLYDYFIECEDRAGNKARAEIREISLTRRYETVDITLSAEYLSRARGGTVNFFPALSSLNGLTGWRIAICDAKGNVKRELRGERFEKMVTFDGTSQDGGQLDDGIYTVFYTAYYASGNEPVSFGKRLIIDNTPPKLSVSHSPRLFSPDGDRENDLLKIELSAKDLSGIRKWSVVVYNSAWEVFKLFAGGSQMPAEILWDGIGSNMDVVESAAEYFIVLQAEDMAGNEAVSKPDTLETDVLVLVTERGLKMRISTIEFAFGSDEIRYKGRLILDRVARILNKYQSYDVLIEGHTDDIGEEEYNLELSERRARAVNDYLLKRGIRADRLRFVGMGETMPLYPNDTDEHRRRNRRVEFLLIKGNAE